MSGPDRRHLSPVPGPYDEAVIAWLTEPENENSSHLIDEALAQLSRARQARRRPWDGLVESLRPEPFGTSLPHLGLILALVGLILAVVAAGILVGGLPSATPDSSPRPPTPSSAASAEASPAPSLVFPLAALPIQFVLNEGEHQGTQPTTAGALTVIRADGTGWREIGLDLPDELVWPEWVPGTDTVLALQGTFNTMEQIWSLDARAGARSQVVIPCVSPCGSRNEAAVSHDGSKVVFFQAWGPLVNGVPAACGLSVYEFATQTITAITDHGCGPEEERHPRFSPDDRTLAFWRSSPTPNSDAQSAIFLRDLGTGEETQLTDWTTAATHLDWSPDGQWIVFLPRLGDFTPVADLWRIRVDGTNLERLTTIDTATTRLLRPLYSPDGQWILFMRATPSGESALFGIPSGGGTPVDVLPGFSVFEHDERPIP